MLARPSMALERHNAQRRVIDFMKADGRYIHLSKEILLPLAYWPSFICAKHHPKRDFNFPVLEACFGGRANLLKLFHAISASLGQIL